MSNPRKTPNVSMATNGWTDKAIEYLLRVTDYRSKAALLTPGMLALLSATVSAIERDGVDADLVLLAEGRDLLREYARRNPGSSLPVDQAAPGVIDG